MTTKFLKQAGTDNFYLYTEYLAARPDIFPASDDEVPASMGGTKKEAAKPAEAAKPKKADA